MENGLKCWKMRSRTRPKGTLRSTNGVHLETEGDSGATFSDWGKPAAGPILKRDGSVQVCGDYKVIVNKSLQKEVYPLPTPDDLFTKLEGGVRFAKLHLSHKYHQVELDRES